MDKDMPISAINIRKISRGESYFDGEHFEGHGAIPKNLQQKT